MSVVAQAREVSVVHGRGDAKVTALAGVDFEVAEGEGVALLGRSGSGKTTLLHVLGGLVEPTSGAAERSAAVSYVFQSPNLLPHFTGFENVAFAARVAAGDGDPAFAPAELLELVGLGAKLDHLPAELSGGEAQRVAIARALAQRPKLLLCDEPTGHLDSDTGERVLELLAALQREFAFALVVATHDVDVAARLRRAVQLHDGRVSSEEVAA